MTQIPLWILAWCYLAAGICYFAAAVRAILAEKQILLLHCVQMMFALVYGLVPFLLFLGESQGERALAYSDYSSSGIMSLYLMFLLSVVGYGAVTVFHRIVLGCKRQGAVSRLPVSHQAEPEHGLACGAAALALGLGALLLWAQSYGALSAVFLKAAGIRSGHWRNPLAFLKQFARVIEFSMLVLFAALGKEKPAGKRKALSIGLLLLAAGGTVLYFLLTDSRLILALSILAMLLIALRHRRRLSMGKCLMICGIILLTALGLTMSADTIARYFRTGVWQASQDSPAARLVSEFKFIYSGQAYAIQSAMHGELKLKFLDDALCAITRWIPERFLPFSLPETVWEYNTENLYGAAASGTSPTDLLTTGIYCLGIPGAILWPCAFGAFIGFLDRRIILAGSSPSAEAYYGYLSGVCLYQVSHNQMSTLAIMLFPAFLYFLICCAVKSLWRLRRTNAKEKAAP